MKSNTVTLIIFFLLSSNSLFSQIISVDRDSLFFPTVSSADTFMLFNLGMEPLVVDSIGNAAGFYLYEFQVISKDTSYYNHFVDGYFDKPFELVLNESDSAKFVIFSPDLCPVCKISTSDYFEDTLLLFNNSINLDTVRIFMSGQGFNIVGVSDISENLPVKQPVLYPNYPNPFNSSTIISYHLPTRQPIRVIVYNTLGQKIAVLLDEVQNAGPHAVEFSAGHLPSGSYFYRLEAQGFVETGKLVFRK